MNDTISETAIQEPPKRTAWLSILLILTFSGSGLGFTVSLLSVVGGGINTTFKSVPLFDTIFIENAHGSWIYLMIKAALFIASLTGASFMWKLKRSGFWIYLAAQLLLLLLPFSLISHFGFAYLLVNLVLNTTFTLLFIILYILQLKRMS